MSPPHVIFPRPLIGPQITRSVQGLSFALPLPTVLHSFKKNPISLFFTVLQFCNNVTFRETINCTRRESKCLPYAGLLLYKALHIRRYWERMKKLPFKLNTPPKGIGIQDFALIIKRFYDFNKSLTYFLSFYCCIGKIWDEGAVGCLHKQNWGCQSFTLKECRIY